MADNSNNYLSTLLNALGPHMKLLSDIGGQANAQGLDYLNKAGGAYDTSLDFFKTILNGKPEDLMKLFDASDLTKETDEQERQNYELAPRGGRRAATAMNLNFNKLSQLNSFIQNLRGQSGGAIGSLAASLAGVGTSEQGISTNALNSVANIRTGIQGNAANIALQQQQIHDALLGSIFESAGTALGLAIGCNTLDTWILMSDYSHRQLRDVNKGDKVLSPIGYEADGDFEELKVIRKDILPRQEIYKLSIDGTMLRGTLSHVLLNSLGHEITLDKIAENLNLMVYLTQEFHIKPIKSITKEAFKDDVAILKLKNEHQNFKYITNGLVSVDADCRS